MVNPGILDSIEIFPIAQLAHEIMLLKAQAMQIDLARILIEVIQVTVR